MNVCLSIHLSIHPQLVENIFSGNFLLQTWILCYYQTSDTINLAHSLKNKDGCQKTMLIQGEKYKFLA